MKNKSHDELIEFFSSIGVRKVLIEKYPYEFEVRIINSTEVGGEKNWWWYSAKYIGCCVMVAPCAELKNETLKYELDFTTNDFYTELTTENLILKRDCVIKL